MLKKDFDNAILHGEKAIELFPNDNNGYFVLGMALRSARRYEEAIVNLETALRLVPLYIGVVVARARDCGESESVR